MSEDAVPVFKLLDMTKKQLDAAVGKLVLVKDPIITTWHKAKLVFVYSLPEGVDEKKRMCLVKKGDGKNYMIAAEHIYYTYQHFSAEIKQYSQSLIVKVGERKYACSAK